VKLTKKNDLLDLLVTKHDGGNQNMGAEKGGTYGKHQHTRNNYKFW